MTSLDSPEPSSIVWAGGVKAYSYKEKSVKLLAELGSLNKLRACSFAKVF